MIDSSNVYLEYRNSFMTSATLIQTYFTFILLILLANLPYSFPRKATNNSFNIYLLYIFVPTIWQAFFLRTGLTEENRLE